MARYQPNIRELIENGEWEHFNGTNTWLLKSPTGNTYTISIVCGEDERLLFHCDCKAYQYGEAEWCKHCEAVIEKYDIEVGMI